MKIGFFWGKWHPKRFENSNGIAKPEEAHDWKEKYPQTRHHSHLIAVEIALYRACVKSADRGAFQKSRISGMAGVPTPMRSCSLIMK